MSHSGTMRQAPGSTLRSSCPQEHHGQHQTQMQSPIMLPDVPFFFRRLYRVKSRPTGQQRMQKQ